MASFHLHYHLPSPPSIFSCICFLCRYILDFLQGWCRGGVGVHPCTFWQWLYPPHLNSSAPPLISLFILCHFLKFLVAFYSYSKFLPRLVLSFSSTQSFLFIFSLSNSIFLCFYLTLLYYTWFSLPFAILFIIALQSFTHFLHLSFFNEFYSYYFYLLLFIFISALSFHFSFFSLLFFLFLLTPFLVTLHFHPFVSHFFFHI